MGIWKVGARTSPARSTLSPVLARQIFRTMRIDRRDHQTRANTLRRVIEWLTQDTSASQVSPDIADLAVARRILRRLAVRGLVRHTPSGWVARRVLSTPAELQQIDPEPEQRLGKERRDVPALQCRYCHRPGFVRHENIVQGSAAERHFFCGSCGRGWKVKDRRSTRSVPPRRDRANDSPPRFLRPG